MAEEDDDFLDLCDENSSPLPDFSAACGASKHLDESAKCFTVSSSDLEPESLENYSDFESDDSISILSPKQDKKNNQQLCSVKSDQNSSSDEIILLSPEKGNKIFTYSPDKSQTCGSSVNFDEDVTYSKILSDSGKNNIPLSTTAHLLKSSIQNKSISNQATELVQSIFKRHDSDLNKTSFTSNSNKPFSGNSSLDDTPLDKTDDNAKHDKRFQLVKSDIISKGECSKSSGEIAEDNKIKHKSWTWLSASQHTMLLSSMADERNKKKENKDRDQWIGMSQWHTKEDTDSFENMTQSATFPKRKQPETERENEKDISPPKRYKTIETDGESPCSNSHPSIVMRNKIDQKTALNTLKRTLDTMAAESMKRETSSSSVGSHNMKTVNVVVKAAVKLREMFPNLTASEIGLKVRSVNNGIMTEEELVQRVVEDIYSTEDSTGDIQIALANPKIQTNQNPKPAGQAKNQTTNSTKGKSLMKKVKKSDSMDIDMDMDSDTDIQEVTVSRLEAIEELDPSKIKLRWDCVPSLPNNAKNLRFIIEMQTPPIKEWKPVAKEVAGKVYVVSNLNPGNDYNFRVRARIGFGNVFDASPVTSVCRKATKVKVPDVISDKIKIPATITKPSQDQAPAKTAPPAVEICQEEVSSSTMLCEACQANTSFDKMVQCCDGHLNCNVCVEKVVKKVLLHGSEETNITCCYTAWYECNSSIPESQAKKVLPSLVFELLEDKLNKKASETIEKMTDLYSCPACKFKVVIEGDLKKFDCPQCKAAICRYCGKVWNETSNHSDCTLNTFMASSNCDRTSILSTLPEGYKDFSAVQLGPETQSELSFVLALFQNDSTFRRHKSVRTEVNRVFRVHNPKLWQKYCLAKDHLVEDIGKDNINEQHLFHGTSTRAIGGICREGLDWRMCGENGTAYGQGTYFAKNSSYSLKYAHAGHGVGRGIGRKTNSGFTFGNAAPAPRFTFGHSQPSFGFGQQQNVQGSYPPNVGFGVLPINTTQQPVFHFGANPVPANANAPMANNNNPPSYGFGPLPVANAPMANNNNPPSYGFGPLPVANAPMANNNNPPSYGFGPLPVANAPMVNNNNTPSFGFGPLPLANAPMVNNNNPPAYGFGPLPVANAPMGNNNNMPSYGFGALPVSNSGAGGNNNFAFGGFPQSTNNPLPLFAPDQSGTTLNDTPKEEQFLDSGKRYMYLARVLVGRPCAGCSGMRKPSRDDQNRPFNSACDNPMRPSIFIIFDSAQCYPEYLIELA